VKTRALITSKGNGRKDRRPAGGDGVDAGDERTKIKRPGGEVGEMSMEYAPKRQDFPLDSLTNATIVACVIGDN
jgi:hypothetical protein